MWENLKTENIKSGFYSILVTEMLVMTTGHIGIGWPSPGRGAMAHDIQGKHKLSFPQPTGLPYMASIY
jgi:hypothetical protein